MNSEVKEDINNITHELKELLEKYEYSYDPPKNNQREISLIYDINNRIEIWENFAKKIII